MVSLAVSKREADNILISVLTYNVTKKRDQTAQCRKFLTEFTIDATKLELLTLFSDAYTGEK